jgi:hypothetical protein
MDPVHLLLHALPAACEYSLEQHDHLLQAIQQCVEELIGVVAIYRNHAAASIRRTLAFGREDSDYDLRHIARQWANCFAEEFVTRLNDGIAKGLMSRMQTPYETDEMLLNSLASLLVGKLFHRWDDSTLATFDRELQSVVRRVEEAALNSKAQIMNQGAALQGLTALIHGRMAELFERLVHLIGIKDAQEMLATIESSTSQTVARKDHHGDS